MNKIITYDNLREFAYSNDRLINGEIKGIVLNFSGCSVCTMYNEDTPLGKFYASHGVIFIIPYYNPWSWMNKPTVEFVDEIVDVIFSHYNLTDIPIASTGGSMGGQGAIVYTARAKRTPKICIANCPNCDAVQGFLHKNNNPRTLYSALYYEDGDVLEAVKTVSPLYIIDELPLDAEYHFFHGDNDVAVNYTLNTKHLYENMKEKGFNVTFTLCKGRAHATVVLDSDKPAKEHILRTFNINAKAYDDAVIINHDAGDGDK